MYHAKLRKLRDGHGAGLSSSVEPPIHKAIAPRAWVTDGCQWSEGDVKCKNPMGGCLEVIILSRFVMDLPVVASVRVLGSVSPKRGYKRIAFP